jgi:hypothetical protein
VSILAMGMTEAEAIVNRARILGMYISSVIYVACLPFKLAVRSVKHIYTRSTSVLESRYGLTSQKHSCVLWKQKGSHQLISDIAARKIEGVVRSDPSPRPCADGYIVPV